MSRALLHVQLLQAWVMLESLHGWVRQKQRTTLRMKADEPNGLLDHLTYPSSIPSINDVSTFTMSHAIGPAHLSFVL